MKHWLFLLSYSVLLTGAEKRKPGDFKLRSTIDGEQQGWFNAEGLPTSIKINDQWVLPSGGTMEWLMTKGYVPDEKRNNVMKPNPFDKRYKKPRIKILPSLATTPVDYIAIPRPRVSNDPFAGLADPMKKKYTPIQSVGIAKEKNTQENEPGPILEPNFPNLENSPFAPNKKNLKVHSEVKNSVDPFANKNLKEKIQKPLNTQSLPGKKIELSNPILIKN